MITVRCLGHIKTSVGMEEVELADDSLTASQIVSRLRALSSEGDPGFNAYNTLALVADGEAYVPASDGRSIVSGDRVVLIPVSHGG